MPRNRRPQDRAEKRDEIVEAAATLFTEAGYDETSMAKVAASAGVTTNTIYWYFADKDALLIAVLDHVVALSVTEMGDLAERPWVEELLWALDRFDRFRQLVTVVHARTTASAAIEAWHDDFHALMDGFLVDGFRRAGVPEADLVPATTMAAFVVEGLLMHPHPEEERRAVVELLVRR